MHIYAFLAEWQSSASDGTNVVKLFEEAVRAGRACRENPPDDFYADVMRLINDE